MAREHGPQRNLKKNCSHFNGKYYAGGVCRFMLKMCENNEWRRRTDREHTSHSDLIRHRSLNSISGYVMLHQAIGKPRWAIMSDNLPQTKMLVEPLCRVGRPKLRPKIALPMKPMKKIFEGIKLEDSSIDGDASQLLLGESLWVIKLSKKNRKKSFTPKT
ncbi:unnamed protein product [Nezara viridula]|uniref:Uncharacterized protein n=1 Tax=Nezara viridula TaxID=85310 RepID=A0A9P0HT34_NEZVI|nr:unnamed protein product [Nezara viridula]